MKLEPLNDGRGEAAPPAALGRRRGATSALWKTREELYMKKSGTKGAVQCTLLG